MMQRFRFRLGRLLDIRRLEEDQAVAVLREASLKLGGLEERLAAIEAEHRGIFRALAAALAKGGLDPAAPMQAALHGARLERLIRETERERADAQVAVRAAQAELQRRRSARKAFEELETRARRDWTEEARREENAFIDEVAGARFAARVM